MSTDLIPPYRGVGEVGGPLTTHPGGVSGVCVCGPLRGTAHPPPTPRALGLSGLKLSPTKRSLSSLGGPHTPSTATNDRIHMANEPSIRIKREAFALMAEDALPF